MDTYELVDGFHALRTRLNEGESEAVHYHRIIGPVLKQLDALYWSGRQDFSRISLLGSWRRGTAVLGLSDFNIAYELPVHFLPDFSQLVAGRDPVLENCHQELLKAFPSAELRPTSQSIAVSLSKGLVIDIRPYFWMKSGDMGYPDPTQFGHWRRFEPMVASDAMLRLDPVERENMVMICRVTRLWRAVHSVPISGLLIDALGLEFIAKAAHRRKAAKYQDCLMRDFFGFMADQDQGRDWWRIAGAEQPVLRTGPFEGIAASAHGVARYAIEQAANRQEKSARAAWRYLLGDYYPAI
jgi:hypothetical protein